MFYVAQNAEKDLYHMNTLATVLRKYIIKVGSLCLYLVIYIPYNLKAKGGLVLMSDNIFWVNFDFFINDVIEEANNLISDSQEIKIITLTPEEYYYIEDQKALTAPKE
jgi:hypothetical protein